MKIKLSWVLMILGWVNLTAFSGVSATPPPLQLSYFEAQNDRTIDWILWNPATQGKTVFKSLAEVPAHIIWLPDKQAVIYTQRREIFQASYVDLAKKPVKLGNLPDKKDVYKLWLAAISKKPRILVMQPVPEGGCKPGPEGELIYRLEDGTEVAGMRSPDWGAPAVCQVWEMKSPAAWKLIVQKGTKWDAGDTPGPSVVNDYLQEAGQSQTTIFDQDRADWVDRRTMPEEAVLKSANIPLPDPEEESLAQVIHPALQSGLVFNVDFGDSLHAMSPVYYLSNNRLKKLELYPDEPTQLSMAMRGRYGLVALEYSGNQPRVIDLMTGKTLLSSQGASAVWVPTARR